MTYRPALPSPLKWAGGKSWLIAELNEMFNAYRARKGMHVRLVDPFCGGLSLPLGLTPERCLIADVNAHLMNFWRWLQHGLEIRTNPWLGIALENDRAIYYENRSKFNALCDAREYWSQEGAVLFYYLNRTCFNGLCRFNNEGLFNVPFGRYKTINYKTSFLDYKEALQGWDLHVGDFQTIQVNTEDFLYLDPPYDNGFTQFAARDFTWDDQVRLAQWAGRCGEGIPVVASNLATARILQLYGDLGFTIKEVLVPRRISCISEGREPAMEMLAVKGL